MEWYRIENKQLIKLHNTEITNLSYDHDPLSDDEISVAWAKIVADEGVYHFNPQKAIDCEGSVSIEQLYLLINGLTAYLVCVDDDGYTVFYKN